MQYDPKLKKAMEQIKFKRPHRNMRKRIADYIWGFMKKHHTCDGHRERIVCTVCGKCYSHSAYLEEKFKQEKS